MLQIALLRAAACTKLMSTNLMKYGTLRGTTAEVNKISDVEEKWKRQQNVF
jgi:hypothetical protein